MAKKRAKRKKGKRRGTKGRTPTGIRPGELSSEYPKTTVRFPPEVRALLERIAEREQRQQWRVLVDAIRQYAVSQGIG